MNQNKNVVVFTLVATFIMLLYSFVVTVFNVHAFSLSNINILSDVFQKTKAPVDSIDIIVAADNVPVSKEKHDTLRVQTDKSFSKFNNGGYITAFYSDTNKPVLPALMHKLYKLKQTKTGKVRIAWFGDSMIEGDLITLTVRKLLQQYFGGAGVGFVPANSVTAGFRTTVLHKWTGDWKEESFKTDECTAPLFLSGHTYYTANGAIIMKDVTTRDTSAPLQKSLICGKCDQDFTCSVNGHDEHFHTCSNYNRFLLDTNQSHAISVAINNQKLPVYGISFEGDNGVVLDNYSFRGISGVELAKLDSAMLNTVDSTCTYDLVVLQYGANILWKPDDTDYTWYQRRIVQVVKKLQKAMPHAEFLIISSGDRAFRYGDEWKTAVGLKNLIKIQAGLAYVDNAAFYNLYESMGGAGTIVSWADGTPQLANKDYIHPNNRGAEKIGTMFFEAFMKGYYKANKIHT